MLKRKDMRRTDWHRILRREYRYAPCSFQRMQGIASLLSLHEVSQPLTIHYEHGDVTIAEAGHQWLQLAFRDAFFWVTAMFDHDHKLLQIYFDITNGNCLGDETNPTFEDLYLDIVMEADGTLHMLDRDELDEALETGEITQEQHALAVSEGEKLYYYLTEHREELVDFCYSQIMMFEKER